MFPFLNKIVNVNQSCTLSGAAGIHASIKDQEDIDLVVSVILPFFSPSFPTISPVRMENDSGLWSS